MAPSAKKLEEALINGTYEVFRAEPDATTVNKVRKHVEANLGLDDGFFNSANWKQKSKAIVKDYVEKALDGWVPETQQETDRKKGVKRASSDAESPAPKRRKGASKLKRAPKKEESDASDLSELSEEEKPKKKSSTTKRKAKVLESDEETPAVKSSTSPERKRKHKVEDESEDEIKAAKREDSDEEGVVKRSVEPDDDKKPKPKPSMKAQEDSDEDEKPSTKEEESKPAVDEEEEYSDVIDEPPKPKRQKKERKDASKPAKSTAKKASAGSPEDPDDAEIKRLQSQLTKCGVRKLWHMELKRHGDDARAKIRHLKKMLADVGMDGRFSEAKAREIKETRELLAEAEAAQEMNALWGTGTGGRASRSKSRGKSTKVEESDGSDAEEPKGGSDGVKDEDEDDDEEDGNNFAARRRRAQADLAFLGDDSDSE